MVLVRVTPAHIAVWVIAALFTAGVIIRPRQWPEALWAVLGATLVLIFGLMPLADAVKAVSKGEDVYLFLVGMMLLAELARQEGLFDWLAALAVKGARGSALRLFVLIYAVGIVVTVFLSNDATAVVLTPAVYAATRQANAKPLPYLYICAFIANAASFVLPISNPANLVVYGTRLPHLATWLVEFGLASVVSIVLTFVALRFTQRRALTDRILHDIRIPHLSGGGRAAAGGILLTGVLLLTASGLGWQLGLPTLLAGAVTAGGVLLLSRRSPRDIVRQISWSVLPLVAGLFVLVAAVEKTGVLAPLIAFLPSSAAASPNATGFFSGTAAAVLCNLVNNLPLGLLAGTVANGAQLAPHVTGALLIGVDLGPNLSVTGSLATILWLVALRREGQRVNAWQFLALGCLVMPPALLASMATFVFLSST